jgi:Ca-activated chloride channel homolog
VRVLPERAQAEPPEALLPFGSALPQAEALEPAENLPPGSIIILSDGADNVAINPALPSELSLDVAARFAADYEVKLHTLAIGRAGGAVTRIDGQDYFIPFEPRSLERLAELSGGEVLDPADEEALARVFRELGTAMRWEATEVEISSLLSGFGLVLMLIAGGLSLQVRRRVP